MLRFFGSGGCRRTGSLLCREGLELPQCQKCSSAERAEQFELRVAARCKTKKSRIEPSDWSMQNQNVVSIQWLNYDANQIKLYDGSTQSRYGPMRSGLARVPNPGDKIKKQMRELCEQYSTTIESLPLKICTKKVGPQMRNNIH